MRVRRRIDPVKLRSRPIAATVTIIFLVTGAVWILATDILLYSVVSDPVRIARLETAKGWLYIGFASAFVYWIVDRAVRTLARSDATLEAVVYSIADGVLIISPARVIAAANPAAARMLGVDKPEALVGMGPEEFTRRYNVGLRDGRLVQAEQLISVRALNGEQPPSYTAWVHPPGRPELVALCTSAPVRPISGGEVELAVTVLHDVTETERLHRMREQFVSAAAHALKTPVSIIKTYVQMLGTTGFPGMPHAGQAIERQCGKIVRLTENLLVLARIWTNTLRLRPEAVRCAQLVEEVTHEMREASVDHGLVTQITAEPVIFADRERVGLVVKNLIEIADRRSRPRTDVTVTLSEGESRARIGVTYEAVLPRELNGLEEGGYTGLGLERYVVESLAPVSRGMLGYEQEGEGQARTDWIEFPTMEGDAHA